MKLRMSAEIRDWLAELRDNNRPVAALVAQAITALAIEGTNLGPPLVIPLIPQDKSRTDYLLEALDQEYQFRLQQLTQMRRRVAEASNLRSELDALIADATRSTAEKEQLRKALQSADDAERRLALTALRAQQDADAFRTRNNVLKARYVAAVAQAGVVELLTEAGEEAPDLGDADTAADVAKEIETQLKDYAPAQDLLELRPLTPATAMVRLIFSFEGESGNEQEQAALLLAVLDGADAVRDDLDEAVTMSADVLHLVRQGDATQTAEHEYPDGQSFLRDLFPDDADRIEATVAALVADNRQSALAAHRERAGYTVEQQATRLRISTDRVLEIEGGKPADLTVADLAAYVESLGGDLRVIADFGDARARLY